MNARVFAALCVLSLTACQGESGDDTGLADARSTVDTDAPAVTTRPLNLSVRRITEAGMSTPAVGARIALDQTGVPRREGTTDDRGWLNFDRIEWSRGPVDVTVYLPGHYLESRVGWTEADFRESVVATRPTIYVAPTYSPGLRVGGDVANMVDPENHTLLVSATVPRTNRFTQPATSYELYAWPSIDFALVAYEYSSESFSGSSAREPVYGWASTPNHRPTGADERIDIDFVAQRIVPTTVSASFALPSGTFFEDPDRGMYVTETDETATQITGTHVAYDIAIDQTVTYTLESIDLPFLSPRYTQVLFVATDGTASAMVAGRARSGPIDVELLAPPTFAAIGPVARASVVSVTGAVPEARTNLRVYSTTDGPTWRIEGGRGASEVRIPELPSGVDAALAYPLGARVALDLCADRFVPYYNCRLFAGGENRPIALE